MSTPVIVANLHDDEMMDHVSLRACVTDCEATGSLELGAKNGKSGAAQVSEILIFFGHCCRLSYFPYTQSMLYVL